MNTSIKNTYVKNQITTALLELLEVKELKEISVSEITTTAGVARVSFYRNYNEKEDVLKEYILKLFGEWTSAYDASGKQSESDLMGAMFKHLTDYKAFYLLLNKRHLSYLLKDVIISICGPKPEYINIEAYTTAFFSYGLYGWIEEWFKRGMQETAEEMTALLNARNM